MSFFFRLSAFVIHAPVLCLIFSPMFWHCFVFLFHQIENFICHTFIFSLFYSFCDDFLLLLLLKLLLKCPNSSFHLPTFQTVHIIFLQIRLVQLSVVLYLGVLYSFLISVDSHKTYLSLGGYCFHIWHVSFLQCKTTSLKFLLIVI